MHSMVYDLQRMTIRSSLGTVPRISIHVYSDLFFTMSYSAHCAHLHIFAHTNSDLDLVFHKLFICIIFILIQPRCACNMHECASKKQFKCA
jgi:hypothetical protein